MVSGNPKRLSIFGVTGSIGLNTVDLVKREPENWQVEAVTAHQNAASLAEVAKSLGATVAVIGNEDKLPELREALAGTNIEAAGGVQALIEAAARPVDITMAAIVGAAGIAPALEAVKQGNCLALANKECLVAAGDIFMREVAQCNTDLIPVDSEHSAVYQSLHSGHHQAIKRVILTASGGPFRTKSFDEIRAATRKDALQHPNWEMGQKITIDSATMMNKGLELIEAYHLFPVTAEQLDVVVHPESVIHGMVEYQDASVIAQMSSPDMRTPIAYSLAWPDRMDAPTEPLDFAKLGRLTFEAPDEARFPALRVAKAALSASGNAPTILNAANEVAVASFLQEGIGLLAIAEICEKVIENVQSRIGMQAPLELADVLSTDEEARLAANELLPSYAI